MKGKRQKAKPSAVPSTYVDPNMSYPRETGNKQAKHTTKPEYKKRMMGMLQNMITEMDQVHTQYIKTSK